MGEAYSALNIIYDRMTDDIDYDAWCSYVLSLVKPCLKRGKILEVGCGTGSITLGLLKAGLSVTAVDLSQGMLRVAEEKIRKSGYMAQLVCQDMRQLDVPRREAVICCCDGPNYLLRDEDLLQFFKSAYDVLRPGGILAFDMSSIWKLEHQLGNQVLFDDREDSTLLWQNTYSPDTHCVTMDLTIFLKEGEMYKRLDESQVQRGYDWQQVLSMLRSVGFTDCKCFDFLTENCVKEDSPRIQYVAHKA